MKPVSSSTDRSPESFEVFFGREYLRLVRALHLLTRAHADAEDLAQEAMTRVCERWERISVMDSPEGYVYRVAMNAFRRWAGGKYRKELRLEDVPAPGTTEDLAEAEVRMRIHAALSDLSQEQREAIMLVSWLGFSADEAGEILDIEPVSIRTRIHRAREALREGGIEW